MKRLFLIILCIVAMQGVTACTQNNINHVTEEDIIFIRWDVCTRLTQDANLCDSLYNPKKLNFN